MLAVVNLLIDRPVSQTAMVGPVFVTLIRTNVWCGAYASGDR